MIEPFLQYWVAQVFWLGLLWLVLYVFLYSIVVPRFVRLRRGREHALQGKNTKAEHLRKDINRLQKLIDERAQKNTKKAKTIVEQARKKSALTVRDVTQEEMDALRAASHAQEASFRADSAQVLKDAQSNPADVAEQFVQKVIRESDV